MSQQFFHFIFCLPSLLFQLNEDKLYSSELEDGEFLRLLLRICAWWTGKAKVSSIKESFLTIKHSLIHLNHHPINSTFDIISCRIDGPDKAFNGWAVSSLWWEASSSPPEAPNFMKDFLEAISSYLQQMSLGSNFWTLAIHNAKLDLHRRSYIDLHQKSSILGENIKNVEPNSGTTPQSNKNEIHLNIIKQKQKRTYCFYSGSAEIHAYVHFNIIRFEFVISTQAIITISNLESKAWSDYQLLVIMVEIENKRWRPWRPKIKVQKILYKLR